MVIEKQRAAEVNRPHADGLSTPANAFELVSGEAEVELLAPWF